MKSMNLSIYPSLSKEIHILLKLAGKGAYTHHDWVLGIKLKGPKNELKFEMTEVKKKKLFPEYSMMDF